MSGNIELKQEIVMKKNIRHGVFETNSSSTHSICIVGGKYDIDSDVDICDSSNEIDIYCSEFGWEQDDFNDLKTKLSYCATYVMQDNNSYNYDKIKAGDIINIPKKKEYDMLNDVVCKVLGSKRINIVPNGDEFYPFGYIDHQSADICGEAFESEESLKDFLFNKESTLRTDNDNH